MSARKPSHFGSKIHAPVLGSSLTRFASIGRIGGLTGSCIICLGTDYTDRSFRCESAEAFLGGSLPRTLVAPSPRRLSETRGSRTLKASDLCNFIEPLSPQKHPPRRVNML